MTYPYTEAQKERARRNRERERILPSRQKLAERTMSHRRGIQTYENQERPVRSGGGLSRRHYDLYWGSGE